MANKDPAFLFYPSDFLTGTMFFSNEEIGIYTKLLCAQHQQNGSINKRIFDSMVSEDSIIREKFKEDKEGYYNQRLLDEMIKRKRKSDNLSANALKRWSNEKQKQCKSNAIASNLDMPIKDRDINKDKDLIDYESLKNTWNYFAKNYKLPEIKTLTKQRLTKLNLRLKEKFDLIDILKIAEKSRFLLGDNKDGWKLTFDWLIVNESNYIKILEGNYNNGTSEKIHTKDKLERISKSIANDSRYQ